MSLLLLCTPKMQISPCTIVNTNHVHNCKQTAHTEYRLFISQLPTSAAAVSPPLGANLMTMYWSKQCFTNLLSAPPSSTKSLWTNYGLWCCKVGLSSDTSNLHLKGSLILQIMSKIHGASALMLFFHDPALKIEQCIVIISSIKTPNKPTNPSGCSFFSLIECIFKEWVLLSTKILKVTDTNEIIINEIPVLLWQSASWNIINRGLKRWNRSWKQDLKIIINVACVCCRSLGWTGNSGQ